MELDGRVAVVTAAGSGMGRACALRFAGAGAHVWVTDLDGAAAEETAARIHDAGGRATARRVDVASSADLQDLFEAVDNKLGTLHVLHNHAGVPGPPGLDVTEEDFDRTVAINLKSAFFATQLALPLLRRAAPHASIIYTASTSGLSSSPGSPVYGMTKGGLLTLMRSVARHLGPDGIRANAVCPGPTQTPMLRVFIDPDREGLNETDAAKAGLERQQQIPLRRIGEADDIAAAALFLASDRSSFITGVALPVDGGHSA